MHTTTRYPVDPARLDGVVDEPLFQAVKRFRVGIGHDLDKKSTRLADAFGRHGNKHFQCKRFGIRI